MKIELLSGATYFPSRVTPNSKIDNEQKVPEQKAAGSKEQFKNFLLENLSPKESGAIQKLFGEIQARENNKAVSAIPLGSLIDITL